jgi:hypothetical protein
MQTLTSPMNPVSANLSMRGIDNTKLPFGNSGNKSLLVCPSRDDLYLVFQATLPIRGRVADQSTPHNNSLGTKYSSLNCHNKIRKSPF